MTRGRRLDPRVAVAATVGVLAVYQQARRHLIPDELHDLTNTSMIGVMAAVAAATGLSAREMGLTRDRLLAGLRLGGVVAGAVGTVVGTAGLFGFDPLGLIGDRAEVSLPEMLVDVLVRIPVATVVFEELAFRGVLTPLLERATTPARAMAWSAALFGVWHVSTPASASAADLAAQVGTFAATAAAGAGFVYLRRRSGSLAAPMVAHWSTNGLAYAVAWLVGR
jgi:membrane protease YdiL (CAAX protease family)